MLKEKEIYFFFKVALILTVLEGYSLKSVPLPWLGSMFFVVICFLSMPKLSMTVPPYLKGFIVLLLWAIIITIGNVSGEYASLMPERATTPYPVFIVLRFLELTVFIITFWLVYRLCMNGYEGKISRFIITLGVVVSIAAVYFYVAQVFGFYYPVQTRMTTGGRMLSQEDIITYSYAFHRAAGTFREPSHLAEWLILPLFLSFASRISKFTVLASVIMLATLFLTGSLTSILAFVIGILVSVLLLSYSFDVKKLRIVTVTAGIFLIAFLLFNLVVYSHPGSNVSLFNVLQQRMLPILTKGTEVTNRAYIYNYFFSNSPSFLGVGFGHGNILFSKALNSEFMGSFLNVFIAFAYNLGIIGLTILLVLLFFPLIQILKKRKTEIIWLTGAYCAWIVIFIGHSEILPPVFGILYGMFLFHLHSERHKNGKEKLQNTDCNV